jgi:hypothetical protein
MHPYIKNDHKIIIRSIVNAEAVFLDMCDPSMNELWVT